MSFFGSVKKQLDDPIFGLSVAFRKDCKKRKVNLGVGAYKSAEGHPYVMSSVKKAEQILLEKHLDKEYLPILGDAEYIKESLKLLYGDLKFAVASAQTIGATGALRVGADFLVRNGISDTVYLSIPTWPNHLLLFEAAGFILKSYPYYDPKRHFLDFSLLLKKIAEIPEKSTVLLQPCCHNPTGLTPSFDQWKELSLLMKKRGVIPFFDIAYQGFGQGLDEDAQVVRYFVQEGHEMLVAGSHSKNFGLYGERVGYLSIVCDDSKAATNINSELQQIIRGNYSMPPLQGERIVTTILTSPDLKREWINELALMRKRIQQMRNALIEKLEDRGKAAHFHFLKNQTGMFSYSGLKEPQVQQLRENYGIYLPLDGRINIASLNWQNIDFVSDALLSVIGS